MGAGRPRSHAAARLPAASPGLPAPLRTPPAHSTLLPRSLCGWLRSAVEARQSGHHRRSWPLHRAVRGTQSVSTGDLKLRKRCAGCRARLLRCPAEGPEQAAAGVERACKCARGAPGPGPTRGLLPLPSPRTRLSGWAVAKGRDKVLPGAALGPRWEAAPTVGSWKPPRQRAQKQARVARLREADISGGARAAGTESHRTWPEAPFGLRPPRGAPGTASFLPSLLDTGGARGTAGLPQGYEHPASCLP